MSAKHKVLAKPRVVQVVLKAHMTKESLHDPAPDYEQYSRAALDWWEDRRKERPDISEIELAEQVVAILRTQDTWGRILREGTN